MSHQNTTSTSIRMICEELGAGTLAGSVTLLTGRVLLHGLLNDLEFTLQGSASGDGAGIEGTWQGDELGTFGCFAASRVGEPGPTECELPSHDPRIESLSGSALPNEEVSFGADMAGALDRPATEGGWRTIAALAGLAAALLAFALWRLRLQRNR